MRIFISVRLSLWHITVKTTWFLNFGHRSMIEKYRCDVMTETDACFHNY